MTNAVVGVMTREGREVAIDLLGCPIHGGPVRLDLNEVSCPQCGEIGRMKGKVACFLANADSFYEGRYNNRTKYIPRGDGTLATLPLRIVLQGYPTTVAAEIPKGAVVAEIGCAGGLAWFGRRYRMVGVDLSYASLVLAEDNYALLVQADARRMPIRDASLDGVVSSCFFEHLTEEGKAALLGECVRVLKPGGKIVFFYDMQTDNALIASYRKHRPDLYQTLFLDGDGHVGYETISQNQAHFRAAGLRILREVYHERTPFLANSAWQKLSRWPGARGRIASIGKALTSGRGRLPALVALAVTDTTVGKLFPATHARCVTTIAQKS